MLDIDFIKNNLDHMKEVMVNRNLNPDLLDELLLVEKERRTLLSAIEKLNQKRNENAAELEKLKDKKSPEAQELIAQGKKIKEEIQLKESEFNVVTEKYHKLMYEVPNSYEEDTPIGKDENENLVIKKVGTPRVFDFTPKDHLELGKDLNMIDNERAAKVTGARFTYIKGQLALLQFALLQYALSIVTDQNKLQEIAEKNGLKIKITPFIPIIPPLMIKPDVFHKMARLEPKEERYHIPSDDLYLIGSSEHTLGAMYIDEILDTEELPIRYIGYSPCFRREAGSYGKDTKGIIRLHQFDKLEMECFTLPEDSLEEQMFIVAIQEYLVASLGLPYQVVRNCSGDMGKPDARQFDIETWMPGQNKYRETHTADLMKDYQARRLNIRAKKDKGTVFVHMNDGTALAMGRIMVAIMENYQEKDGSIGIPEVLKKYIGKDIMKTTGLSDTQQG